MGRLVIYRVALVVPVLVLVTGLTFLLVSFIPGDAAIAILGQNATPQKIAALNEQLGLDRPFWVQYTEWMSRALRGNFGTSINSGEPVATLVAQRFAPTIYLAGFATLIATLIGVAIGSTAAVRGGPLARALDAVAMLGISLPNFWIALLLVVVVSGELNALPALGYVDPSTNFSGWMSHLVLPVASLAVAGVAIVAKQTRDAMGEALSRDFMRFMQANGIPRMTLILRHGLRYTAVPIVSSAVACFINLFGGTVSVESVFAIPGLGSLVSNAAYQHDIVTIQGAVFSYTVVILVVTLAADVVYFLLNPKVRTR